MAMEPRWSVKRISNNPPTAPMIEVSEAVTAGLGVLAGALVGSAIGRHTVVYSARQWFTFFSKVGAMATLWLLAVLVAGPLAAETVGNSGAPNYTAESIANTAANVAGFFSPNTFVTIYGTNLANAARAIGPDDLIAGTLPTALPGANVRVLVNQIAANLYYVSPAQVNVLLPASLVAGNATLQVGRDGIFGPEVTIKLNVSAPALFQSDASTVIATHGNGAVVTPASPAKRGETVVLYASGLGPTSPPVISGKLAQGAAQVADVANFRVWLNGTAVDPKRVAYAGVTPGFAGLFQINVQLPDDSPANSEIRVGYADQQSPAGRVLPLQ